ncbi:MAG: cobyric acid synthase [Candidatus Methanoplasma sp.]|jgi:adenosylcobyric acid synthase|nr:cobyric acid synthase [Candidatus Methanoplasma sp.]
MKVIFLGTSSGAGKTTLTALYCRHLYKKGVKVAPFKASNLALNSFVTKEGLEMGVGQAFQAWVSGIEPSIDMNPILLKPVGKGRIRLMINGEAQDETARDNPWDTKAVMKQACEAFDRLSGKYEAVVCEGSGSPVELNIMDRDVANIGLMRERRIPAILVGDVERGGVFAALYGTWLLMPEDIRPLVKGFIINRFRGDPSILRGAIEKIEELTGMRFIGTIPYVALRFPEEDSLSETAVRPDGQTPIEVFIDNADSLLETAADSGLDLKKIDEISSA